MKKSALRNFPKKLMVFRDRENSDRFPPISPETKLVKADFNFLPTPNPETKALLAPQPPKHFFSMVPPDFRQDSPDGFQKDPGKSGKSEKSEHLTLDATI